MVTLSVNSREKPNHVPHVLKRQDYHTAARGVLRLINCMRKSVDHVAPAMPTSVAVIIAGRSRAKTRAFSSGRPAGMNSGDMFVGHFSFLVRCQPELSSNMTRGRRAAASITCAALVQHISAFLG